VTSDRFERGDHLKVKRWGVYEHHGIYVGDGIVIDFSGRTSEKGNVRVRRRDLSDFERVPGSSTVVVHPQTLPFGEWLERYIEPDEVVRRAEALANVATQGKYRLTGSNCENIANWCKCGAPESRQVRNFHAWHAVLGLGLMAWTGRWPHKRTRLLIGVVVVSTAVTLYMQAEARITPGRWRSTLSAAEELLRSGTST
jgi:hypothetical protein